MEYNYDITIYGVTYVILHVTFMNRKSQLTSNLPIILMHMCSSVYHFIALI